MITGKVLDVEPGRSLSMTCNGHWSSDVDALPESTVRSDVVDPFVPMPGVTTFLSCQHTGLPDAEAAAHLEAGWVTIRSGLKTLLETGGPLSGPPA